MNTTEWIDAIHAQAVAGGMNISKADVTTLINIATEVGVKAIVEEPDHRLLIRKFGTIKAIKRKGRIYTVQDKMVSVDDRVNAVFKPGTGLAECLEKMDPNEL
jgi:nucleoid DNA-binding protein